MKIELLKGITTLEELKGAYKKLAMKFHPDRGGSIEKMQALNAEYEYLSKELKESAENTAMYIDIINALIDIEGLTIEIVGTWIWVSGDTKPHKELLKELKFRWNKTRELWQKRPEGDTKRTRGNKKSDAEIKNFYGCQTIKGTPSTGRAALV